MTSKKGTKTYIVARQQSHAAHYARENKLKPNEWQSITNVRDLERMAGIRNPRVIWYETASELKDYHEIVNRIRMYFPAEGKKLIGEE